MRVIAMGYGMEPLDRITAGSEGSVIYIVKSHMNQSVDNDEGAGVGFPYQCVFEYNAALWRDLSDAWLDGDMARLETLWSRATPVAVMAEV